MASMYALRTKSGGKSSSERARPRHVAGATCCFMLRPTRSPGPRVDVFFRRIIGVRRRAAQAEFLAAVDAHAVRRLVLVRLDLSVQAHFAVLVGRRGSVLRAERIFDDLVTGKKRFILALRSNAAAIPTDIVGLLHEREQLERAFRREMGTNRANHRPNLVDELGDLRFTAGRIRTLLTRRNRGEARLNALQVRKDGMVDAIGATVLGFEGANVLLTLRARCVVEFERARLHASIRFGARDLQHGPCRLYHGERRAATVLALRDMFNTPSDRKGRWPSSGAASLRDAEYPGVSG